MRVAAQAVGVLADDQGELGVGFESDDAVDHVDAGFFQLLGHFDVALFVEARPNSTRQTTCLPASAALINWRMNGLSSPVR